VARLAIEDRQDELAQLIRSQDAGARELALPAVTGMQRISPVISQALLAEAELIKDGIRDFNRMDEKDAAFLSVQVELRSRFNYWKRAWWTAFHQLGIDGRRPVEEIHDLATERSRGTSMDEIVLNARVVLDALDGSGGSQP